MKPRIVLFWILGLVAWISIFVYQGLNNIDPDFGWHVQMGRYITTNGIPTTDPFSYTMPTYPFIDHEWLTNVVMYWILNHWGYPAEAVVFGLLAGVLLVLLFPRGKETWALIPFLLGASIFVTRGGVRPQILDWIFLAFLLRLFWHRKTWEKWRWTVIPVFALWANLHGGFAIGPVVLSALILFQSLQDKKIDPRNLFVWVGGVVATFINPYGPRLWHEVWMQMTDSNLRWSVAEWQPFWVKPELGIWLLTTLVWAMLKRINFKVSAWKLGAAVCFLLAGLSSLRHMSLLAVFLIFLSIDLTRGLVTDISKDKISLRRARKFYLLVTAISLLVFLAESGAVVWKTSRGRGGISYPENAVWFLQAADYPGNVFSEYGWGGYLIWQYPEKKVFIDGRMPSWRRTAPAGESDWAFKDYIRIRDEGEYLDLFSRYHISVVLWPANGLIESKPVNVPTWWTKLMHLGIAKEPFDLTKKLESDGWKRVYADGISVVYLNQL